MGYRMCLCSHMRRVIWFNLTTFAAFYAADTAEMRDAHSQRDRGEVIARRASTEMSNGNAGLWSERHGTKNAHLQRAHYTRFFLSLRANRKGNSAPIHTTIQQTPNVVILNGWFSLIWLNEVLFHLLHTVWYTIIYNLAVALPRPLLVLPLAGGCVLVRWEDTDIETTHKWQSYYPQWFVM